MGKRKQHDYIALLEQHIAEHEQADPTYYKGSDPGRHKPATVERTVTVKLPNILNPQSFAEGFNVVTYTKDEHRPETNREPVTDKERLLRQYERDHP